MWLTAATAALRFGTDTALMFLFGCSGMIFLGMQVGVWNGEQPFLYSRRLAAVLAVIALFGLLGTQAASVADGWQSAFDPATLKSVLLQTSYGHAWIVRLVAALAVLSIVLASRRIRVITSFAGIALATASLTGHAAMNEGAFGIMQRLVQALHLLCTGAWVGSLVPVFSLFTVLQQPSQRQAAARALRRYSSLGHVAVAGVLLTGAANTAFVLGRWPLDWHSPYQALLLVKIALSLLMTALAIVNRYLWVPRLSRAPAATTRALRFCTLGELAAAAGTLALVSILGLIDPA